MNAVTFPDTTPQKLTLPNWLKDYLLSLELDQTNPDVDLICRAFNFAYQLHEGQTRKSGEPYIAHPVAVATILRDLGGDKAMIAAGFLHDVVEDTDVTVEEIEQRFGQEVALLVEGVTKLSKFNFSNKTEQQAENFRRMFLAMAKDIRVIVVKLSDRLHNMRTLEPLRPEKQRRIALETKEIFAPLANRLGIWRVKWELEDLSFKYLEPEDYRQIQNFVSEKRIDRETRIETVKKLLQKRLDTMNIQVEELQGRPKHLYGIYSKMQRQNKGFHEIYDLAALRIIVQSNEECYRSLAVVHDLFKPMPGRFKDYIGLPKPNLYQSLHTTVVGLNGRPLEIQIRTLEMHHIAEYGIAAHWKYKETGGSHDTQFSDEDEKFTWLRQLLDWQNDLKDDQEYVDNLKDNLFDDDVYVFTPNGDVIALARGATAVDFAYRIHTEVGNHMKGARINGKWSVLDQPLQNGDIVEIITQNNCHPSLDWLNFVVTPTARNRIRQWFKRSRREENMGRGREILEKELGKNGFEALLKSDPMLTVAHKCNYQSVDDLLAGLGYGGVTLNQVVNRVREVTVTQQKEDASEMSLPSASPSPACPAKPNKSPILGVEGLVYHIAGCCKPLPGDPIIGVVTRGNRGISIHNQSCSNLENIPGEQFIPVRWNTLDSKDCVATYPVDLQIEALDRVGVLKDILLRLSDHHVNVCDAGVKTGRNKPAIINLQIEIRNRQQLEYIINRISNMSDVLHIHRVNGVDF
ncbi:MAG: bifunctional (p)ppGpp synthetase/guanosine-3',5'-bis(diphosphate) 3'-pyrophosphohydrolase [Crocosphaera sp.]